jgi:hypothetical protein
MIRSCYSFHYDSFRILMEEPVPTIPTSWQVMVGNVVASSFGILSTRSVLRLNYPSYTWLVTHLSVYNDHWDAFVSVTGVFRSRCTILFTVWCLNGLTWHVVSEISCFCNKWYIPNIWGFVSRLWELLLFRQTHNV